MTVESWITPEETPSLAQEATEVINTRLARFTDAERAAFWASIRKAYNTPYNDPAPRERPKPVKPAEAPPPSVSLPEKDLPEVPLAAIPAAAVLAEMHAV
ncbi:hypothetical protein [Methylobacterium organophilum]|uniref:Uncharacterized protein n=1 Tax=Methylobacterium organophilum TaxID=410 RepID=A0ABQ4TAE7_METOR|nr:hypothetical protein [Methylobacterium organophilum]GJE28651.1 hypothetical protein LKMONMHP_3524 [Methylobacterium organophilum]